ncbi:HupE/UreJ family protein [Photobacterium lutimaris]|uniref:Urease accessory protein UreJ n=1 Tax=Photobacterium lutimaris TaxID=388278 RepID=A0A2T3J2M1_9GAMM|nr:HupE/UreJ family protein [Photobacterium lutimaris]PSU35542.1 urease accessory protein UreJ [Photobacterium lutimaris]TDR78593.1 urease accessory protein [Photobacterium lutimaris]
MKTTRIISSLATLSLILPASVQAHSGHDHSSFFSGLVHPVTGIDHLIMLLAFGALAFLAVKKTSTQLSLLAAALVAMVAGMAAGLNWGAITGIEGAIAASLLVVSAALWQVFSGSQMVTRMAVALCVALIFCHGYAHGIEASGNVSMFAVAMAISASALLLLGHRLAALTSSRWLSAGVASASLAYLLVA